MRQVTPLTVMLVAHLLVVVSLWLSLRPDHVACTPAWEEGAAT